MNELVDGVPNAEAAIAYALKRWGYRQGTKECIAFYRGACWLQLVSIPPNTPVEAGKDATRVKQLMAAMRLAVETEHPIYNIRLAKKK